MSAFFFITFKLYLNLKRKHGKKVRKEGKKGTQSGLMVIYTYCPKQDQKQETRSKAY